MQSTKQHLDGQKYFQSSGDTLNLSGATTVFGNLSLGSNVNITTGNQLISKNYLNLSGTTAKINQGTTYTQVGVLLDELFSGNTLNATNWSGSLPTGIGASINNKLIVTSGATNWSKYIQLVKFFTFEKETFEINFKAVTKNSGNAWGIHQNLSLLAVGNQSIYIKFDQGTGTTSGMISIGNTTAANEYGYSQPLTFSAGDQLKLTIIKRPGKTLTILENITSPSNTKAYGDFGVDIKTTGGQYRLTFLGGQQEFSEFKVTSNCRNFGGTFGVVFFGDSQTAGAGNSDVVFRWADRLMKGQSHLYEVIGNSTWRTTDFTAPRVTEFLSGINAKYLVVNTGYNDWQFNFSSPATYEAALETVATTAQGLGYIVIFVSMVPAFTGTDNTSFDAQMVTAAANTSSQYISVRSALSVGVKLNPNYVITDGIHINDDGCAVMANTVALSVPTLYSQLLIDFNKADVRTNSLPFGKSSMSLVGIDSDGRQFKLDPSKYLTPNTVNLYTGTLRAQQTGGVGITGNFVFGGTIQQLNATAQGLRIGFNNGASDNNCTNINITNAGVGGVGAPQAFSNITGLRNIDIIAGSSGGSWKTASDHTISGNDNILVQSNLGGSAVNLSGSNNLIFGSSRIGGFTSANNNIGFGPNSFSGLATGSQNIVISTLSDAGGNNVTWGAAQTGTIFIGTPWDANFAAEALANGETAICAYNSASAQKIFTFGPKGARASSVLWRPGYQGGINVNGYSLFLDAARGTGSGNSGDIRFRFSIPSSSGSTVHSTYAENLVLNRTSITIRGGVDIVLSATTGTKIGTSAIQKMGFYGATPIVKPSGDTGTALLNLGLVGNPLPKYSSGRVTAQTSANASIATVTAPASDSSYIVSANVLVTSSTAHTFTITCTYTDEGNTSRTVTLNFSQISGTIGTSITNAAGAVPYEGIPLHIRCKASTTITIASTGTFTTVTYNAEGVITQVK